MFKHLITALAVTSTLLATASAALADEAEDFMRLNSQKDYRYSYQNRIEQEILSWKTTQPDPELYRSTRLLFNLAPQDRTLRPAMSRMLAAQKPLPGASGKNLQDLELNRYMLLNLEPRNESYRTELADLLLRKHGNYAPAAVKNAYSLLNDAFNVWDEGKYDQALNLFRQAQAPLANSPELTALLATHLRDRGKVEEALNLLRNFKGNRTYLGWIDGLQQQMSAAQSLLGSNLPESERIPAWLGLGNLSLAGEAIKRLPEGASKHWYQAKWLEKQGQYHPASAEYLKFYQQRWASQLPGFAAVVYKAQLEDVNSLDLIALKFRTSPELIRQVNQAWPYDWVETYRMLVIPVAPHHFSWPATGYVSSHFGYRLHPIRGTWRLHEGVDIETLPGVQGHAAAPGTVTMAAFDSECGNMIKLQHPEPGLGTAYCHGQKLLVKPGDKVTANQAIMITGDTGTASASNHLHFGVTLNGVYVDPMDWL